MSGNSFTALLVGVQEEAFADIKKVLGSTAQIVELKTFVEFEKLIDIAVQPPPVIVFCGPSIIEMQGNELAQCIAMLFQEIPTYFITTKREGYERKNLINNGFTDAFVMPFDSNIFFRNIGEYVLKITTGVSPYKAVKMIDLKANTKL